MRRAAIYLLALDIEIPDRLPYQDTELDFMCFFSRVLREILYDVSIKIKHFHIIDAASDYDPLRFRYNSCDGVGGIG
jgi:hypothetical protein